jgi:DNA-directed RNA polymerase beta' subunit
MIKLDFEIYKKVDELAEITSQKIYISNRQERFHAEGLYSEQIFGPINKFRCQCGSLFGRLNAGKRCEECGVMCSDTNERSETFAKITFPDNIYVVNPIFKSILQQIFGQNAIKSILQKRDYQANSEFPYYFSLEKHKLLKESKMKEDEEKIDMPVTDIVSLKKLFDVIREMPEYKDHLESFVLDPIFLDYIFVDFVLVVPPNSRHIIKISPTKILPHPVTKCYIQILKNSVKSGGVSDQLFSANPEYFGYTVYKYQALIDEIFEIIMEFSFQKKESYVREALTGKTVEFSQRTVVVPNPALRPYQVGLNASSVKKIFLPELLHYLYQKYEDEAFNDEHFTVMDFVQYIYELFNGDFDINIREEDFEDFLNQYMTKFRVLVERAPTLWRYNAAGYVVANVFNDEDDIMPVKRDPIIIEDNIGFQDIFSGAIDSDFFEDEIVLETEEKYAL